MKKNAVTAGFLISIALQFLLSGADGAEVCEWKSTDCPGDLDGKIITVPEKVIALSPNILACPARDVIERSDTPAIMFVIDHSTSMDGSGMGAQGNDVPGNRFLVTRNLLDTIFAVQPGTRVGLALFREGLFLDKRTHDILEALESIPDSLKETPVLEDTIGMSSRDKQNALNRYNQRVATAEIYKNQAFLPPVKLDSTYTVNSEKMQGIEILKTLLDVQITSGRARLRYTPQFNMPSGTNINYAFLAARQGLKHVPQDIIPKKHQYIIFFSDGVPTEGGHLEVMDFQKAEETATTFTVYLHARDSVPPDTLVTMTENIRNNGFSENNPKSQIWARNSQADSLMSLFMANVISPIFKVDSGTPLVLKLKISHRTGNQSENISTTYKENAFQFSDAFAISNDTTGFSMEVTYDNDSTALSEFKIVRSGNAREPSHGQLDCWERDLALYYDGKPVTAVNETMNNLEVVFTASTDRYKSVSVLVTHKSTKATEDRFNLQLDKNDENWSKQFKREVADATPTDNVLQHENPDSIILIFRNPQNSLDTIRKAYPFAIGKILSFTDAHYYDANADGFVDSIFIKVEGPVVKEDLDKLKSSFHLPSFRNFKIESLDIVNEGIAFKVTERGEGGPKTYVTLADFIIVDGGMLPAGGIITGNMRLDIKDKVAPVLLEASIKPTEAHDSLRLKFSEPVDQFSSKRPVLFIHDGKEYQVELDEKGVFRQEVYYTARVVSVQSGFVIYPNDSVFINPLAKISDTAGNAQLNPKNRRVNVKVDEIPIDIRVKTYNNPGEPDVPIPERVRNALAQKYGGGNIPTHGITIVIEPVADIKTAIKIDNSSTIAIYDVVKNLIARSDPGKGDKERVKGGFDEITQKFYFVWDYISDKGRKVGTGTYTAVYRIKIIDKSGNAKIIPGSVHIGVKRKKGS